MDDLADDYQIESALLSGIVAPRGITWRQLKELVAQDKKQSYNSPPNSVQLQLAASWGTTLDGLATRAAARSYFYSFLEAREWVYSVLRHAYGANWRSYDDSGIDMRTVGAIAAELLREPGCLESAGELNIRQGAGDRWVTITKKRQATAAYAFVVARIAGAQDAEPTVVTDRPRRTTKVKSRVRRPKNAGCFGVLVLFAFMIVVILRLTTT